MIRTILSWIAFVSVFIFGPYLAFDTLSEAFRKHDWLEVFAGVIIAIGTISVYYAVIVLLVKRRRRGRSQPT